MAELDPEFLPAPRPCRVAERLSQLSKKDRAKFDVALGDERASDRKIAEAFTRRGLNVGDEAVGKHRRGACACD